MTKHYYPPLDERNINLVVQLVQEIEGYLNDPDCPYGEGIKQLFNNNNPSKYFDNLDSTNGIDLNDDSALADQLNILYSRMQEYWTEVKHSDKSQDKNSYFRTSTALIEKLIDLKERASRIQQANSFTSEMIRIMDEIMTPDQRNEVKLRLEKFNLGEEL